MASVNKVILVGNLGQDPEVKYMPSGDAIANISVATTDKWKDKNGEKQEKTEWHRVSFFGKLAEIVGEYLKKGSSIYLEGRLQTRKWQDKDGNDRYTTEIVADKMQMLGGGGGNASGNGNRRESSESGGGYRESSGRSSSSGGGGGNAHRSSPPDDFEDDIPFATCDFSMDPILKKIPNRFN